MAEFTDNRGTLLEVGLPVAYNLSGQIAKGLIQSVQPGKQYWQKPNKWDKQGLATVKVELLHDAAGYKAGHVSKVQNQRNLLVLLTDEA